MTARARDSPAFNPLADARQGGQLEFFRREELCRCDMDAANPILEQAVAPPPFIAEGHAGRAESGDRLMVSTLTSGVYRALERMRKSLSANIVTLPYVNPRRSPRKS